MSNASPRAGFGIITALPVEYAAARQLIERPQQISLPGDPTPYLMGELPSTRQAVPHVVVLSMLPRDGTRTAAAACAYLLAAFPTIRAIVMIGIAGGVPAIDNPSRHVRLGDIVVATEIIDYGHVRSVNGSQEIRARIDGPSLDLAIADRLLQADEMAGRRPWEKWLEPGSNGLPANFARPELETDVLLLGDRPVAHPDDSVHGRRMGFPRVHRGIVASGDQLVRDEATRDRLAGRYGICAIEMEAAGIAAGTTMRHVPWFMVRGIADYCNNVKNDVWHPYASFAAAAYTRALLSYCEPIDNPGSTVDTQADHGAHYVVPINNAILLPKAEPVRGPIHSLQAIVSAMLEIEEILDIGSRSMLTALLPRNIQTAIMNQPNARLQVISIVRACAAFHDGQQALLTALRACVPEGSMALARAEVIIAHHWYGLLS